VLGASESIGRASSGGHRAWPGSLRPAVRVPLGMKP